MVPTTHSAPTSPSIPCSLFAASQVPLWISLCPSATSLQLFPGPFLPTFRKISKHLLDNFLPGGGVRPFPFVPGVTGTLFRYISHHISRQLVICLHICLSYQLFKGLGLDSTVPAGQRGLTFRENPRHMAQQGGSDVQTRGHTQSRSHTPKNPNSQVESF